MEADLTGYTSPLSVWKLVEQHVAAHERDELKSLLGVGQVEETLELHEELDTLLEIWSDCRNNSQPMQPAGRLPEPPGMRERLTQEILFFVENVREKAQHEGRDDTKMLRKYDGEILDYVESKTSNPRPTSDEPPFKRPLSALRDGRETPAIRIGTPTSDRMSSSSTLSEDVEAMSDKLNILKLDEVSQHLRACLTEEREQLIGDLRFLQQCIEDEDYFTRQQCPPPEPSIADLRAERLKMEKDMLSDVFVQQTPAVGNAMRNNQPHNLRPATNKSRTPIVPSHGPMKAVHLHAPEGIVLEGQVPDSVVHKAQQRLVSDQFSNQSRELSANHARFIKVGSISANKLAGKTHPSPPSSATTRPSSALRFRKMVMSARDDDD